MDTPAPAPSDGEDSVSSPADLLTVFEVAARLRVSKMTIYRMVNSGELAAFKIGKSFRIPVASVQNLLSSPIH
ncbi:MAG TPA: helix-turn-helix domain-containing protein [Pseudonocardia sp.]|jgi:excisionase family DNA binding protein